MVLVRPTCNSAWASHVWTAWNGSWAYFNTAWLDVWDLCCQQVQRYPEVRNFSTSRDCPQLPKDANQNRANQKNPFHEAFWKSRSIEPGKVETVFHGTSKEAAQSILTKGFNSSKDGLLGAGVYVTTDESALQEGLLMLELVEKTLSRVES